MVEAGDECEGHTRTHHRRPRLEEAPATLRPCGTPLHRAQSHRSADIPTPHPGGRGGHGRGRAGDGSRGWVGDATRAMVAAGD
jgi:hypothetical protein